MSKRRFDIRPSCGFLPVRQPFFVIPKIYPDFIFAAQGHGEAKRITVLETKGDQLDNLDTAYKREVLAFLSDSFAWDDYTPAGQLELVQNNGETVQCTLILMSEWRVKLPEYLMADEPS